MPSKTGWRASLTIEKSMNAIFYLPENGHEERALVSDGGDVALSKLVHRRFRLLFGKVSEEIQAPAAHVAKKKKKKEKGENEKQKSVRRFTL